MKFIQTAKSKGATVLCGGHHPQVKSSVQDLDCFIIDMYWLLNDATNEW